MVMPKGYKKTEIGIIPEDWEIGTVESFGSIVSGGTPSTTNDLYWNGNIRWCTPTDIKATTTPKISHTQKHITEKGLEDSSAVLLPINSVMICTRATIGEIRFNSLPMATNQGFKNIIVKNGDYLYLYYILTTKKHEMIALSYGTTFLELSKKALCAIPLQIPKISEQHAISNALYTIDILIDNLEKLIEKKKNIKQGAMQELLTGKRRLPGFTGGWTVKTIGRSGYLYKETINPQLSPLVLFYEYSMPAFDNGKQPIMKYGKDMHSNRTVISGKVLLFNKLNVRQKRIWLIDAEKEKSVCSSEFLAYYSDEIDLLYLNYLLNSSKITKNFIDSSTGTSNSQQRITPDVFLGYSITVPSDIEEQTAIASILYDMDNEIAELEKKLAKYRCLKQGMMSELLTGHIRLTEKEDA